MEINKNRLGRFRIQYEHVYDKPHIIIGLLHRISAVPIEIQQVYDEDVFIYTAISNEFTIVNVCEDIPFYDLFCTCNSDGNVISVDVRKK